MRNLGFTLIELLVGIAIVAVLSTIGLEIFGSIQKMARDARRKGDIDAIAKALEVNKSATQYQTPLGNWFSSGAIPYDPLGSGLGNYSRTGCGTGGEDGTLKNRCWYCMKNPTLPGAGPYYCTNQDYPDFHLSASGAWGTPGFAKNGWIVCANLETGSPKFYCKTNQQ
ncbi:MAG: type II secretion system protein [Candidatus Levybacteria bacterium]|nr:type II secretion system protein [Candidatus Levybacteria bacterium]